MGEKLYLSVRQLHVIIFFVSLKKNMDNQVVEAAVTMVTLGAWALEEVGRGACTEDSVLQAKIFTWKLESFFFLYRDVFAYS